MAEVLAARAPKLDPDQLQTSAAVTTQIFAALLGTIVSSSPETRETWITELNRALTGYIAPILARAGAEA